MLVDVIRHSQDAPQRIEVVCDGRVHAGGAGQRGARGSGHRSLS